MNSWKSDGMIVQWYEKCATAFSALWLEIITEVRCKCSSNTSCCVLVESQEMKVLLALLF